MSAAAAGNEATHFDISQLPSLKDGGMTLKEESLQRRRTCRFIEEAGRSTDLKLPRVAVSTAMVFFHRFYAKHSFHDHDRFEVAVACIVLAGKTEESPKKLNTVIQECYKLKMRGMRRGPSSPEPAPSLDIEGEEFSKLKERVLLLERVILHTIGFELSVDHPYKFLVDQLRLLVNRRELEYITPPPDAGGLSTSEMYAMMLQKLVQYSMNFANDSMQTTLCLQFQPQEISTAVVYLSGQCAKVRPSGGKDWLTVLQKPNVESLASISLQILELVMEKKSIDQVAYAKIRANLDQLGKGGGGSTSPRPALPSKQPDPKRQRVG